MATLVRGPATFQEGGQLGGTVKAVTSASQSPLTSVGRGVRGGAQRQVSGLWPGSGRAQGKVAGSASLRGAFICH